MKRRRVNVFGLAFLDAITCGFGAVVLFYMVINASIGLHSGRLTSDLRAEVDRLEIEVLEGHENVVELRNAMRDVDDRSAAASGLARRLIEEIEAIREELATYDQTTLARQEHINRLKTDLKSLEEEARRLSAAAPSEETPGDRLRAFVGDGDRQYLTGLKVGGRRILVLLDASASMLDDTLVNIVRRRNLPDDVKVRAEKWQQALSTVDWLSTQLPQDSRFQVYAFAERARPVVEGTAGQWLDAGDREALDGAVQAARTLVPDGGTNLHAAFEAASALQPPPDNLILITDGLPTQGKSEPRGRTISGKQRLRLFRRAVETLRAGVPVNVVLLPMEGDPAAASEFWKLAVATHGSFMSPSRDWP